MKKIFAIMMLFGLTIFSAYAEDNSQIKTIFPSGEVKHSFYGSLVTKIGPVDKKTSIMVGGRLAWLMNNTFAVGIAGNGMLPFREVEYKNTLNQVREARLVNGYGGLFLEYINNPIEPIHLSAACLFGFGGIGAADKDNWDNDMYDDNDMNNNPWAAYYVIEPEIKLEANVTNFLKIGASAGYRFCETFEKSNLFESNSNLNNMEINGFTGGIHFIFGMF